MNDEELIKDVIASHKRYEGRRCRVCAIQPDYLRRCLNTLMTWPKPDKKTQEWIDKVEGFRCKER